MGNARLYIAVLANGQCNIYTWKSSVYNNFGCFLAVYARVFIQGRISFTIVVVVL